MRDLEELGRWAERSRDRLRDLYGITRPRPRDRQTIEQVSRQLDQLLPVEGAITQRLSELRALAHHAKHGQLQKVNELAKEANRLSGPARGRAAHQLRNRYRVMQLDLRLERMDRSATALESRVRELTLRARQCLSERRMREVSKLLKEAERRQKQAAKLVHQIERTEARLMREGREAIGREG